MVFSSHVFVYYFLPLAVGTYYALPRRLRHAGLVVLSYVFYGWANPAFTILMATSTAVDYVCGLAIQAGRHRRSALVVSIVTNLALLGFFKYFNFAVENFNAALEMVGLGRLQADSVLQVVLPLGISFYTFQSMSYTIDVYRGDAKVLRNPIDFACYVSLFPQLVAGPIIRFSEIAEQLRHRSHTLQKMARGAAFLCLGLGKKVLLANPCGKVADTVFDAGAIETLDAWIGLFSYSMQIYFDFSGYSDIAIGLGLILGFVFPKNFDSPYQARSITDFWRRWHISLSSWLRDYLYIPLGGNRRGARRTYVNLALVMLLGGLWHGAAWNFVVWGAFHGCLLALERWRGGRGLFDGWSRPLQITATFLVVSIGWIPFRSESLADAGRFLLALVGLGEPSAAAALVGAVVLSPYHLAVLAVAATVALVGRQTWDWTRQLGVPQALACLALLWLSLAVLQTQTYNPFIYFIF